MCHYQLQVILATAKQEPRKSRPLWGKGDRGSGGRGELGNYQDCRPTSPPIPITTVQLTRTNHARLYNPASELPLSEPSRAHLSPKGEAYCTNHANKTAPNAQGHTTPQASSPSPIPSRVPPLPKGRGLFYEPCLYLYRKQVIITTIKHSSYKALAREIALVHIRAYSCPRKKTTFRIGRSFAYSCCNTVVSRLTRPAAER